MVILQASLRMGRSVLVCVLPCNSTKFRLFLTRSYLFGGIFERARVRARAVTKLGGEYGIVTLMSDVTFL